MKSTEAILLIALSVLAAPASAAGMAGKWYAGKLDSEPVISIAKTGADYSAALDNPDTTKTVQFGDSMRRFKQATHKDLTAFEAAGTEIRFTIRNIISINGDNNYLREEYSLHLSDDGSQLTGTERRTWYNEGPNMPRTSVTPVTLYQTANSQP